METRAELLSFDAALDRLLSGAAPLTGVERVATIDACGRVLATDVRSGIDVPPMDNTQMDGYAVRASEVRPGVKFVIAQRIAAGQIGVRLAPGTVARIFTGASIPEGADAVVMQEAARVDGEGVSFDEAVVAGQWIRRAGEDIKAGAVVLSRGDRLSPQAVGLAASVGCASLEVFEPVRVACFFTGDELAMPGDTLRPGAIYNSNRFVLVGLLRRLGCEVTDLGIVPDSFDATCAALRRAASGNDLIVTSGGMSVGEEDHVRAAVESEGALDMWQIAIKPGKPLAYGRVRRQGPGHAHFIGLPGNPVSSLVTFLLFVRPFVRRLFGARSVEPTAIVLRADFDWPKADRRREFLRARINADGGLDLFPNQSSGVLTSTVWADGLIDNPPGATIGRGDAVRFLPFANLLD